jgi:hypothetical protein
MSRGSFSRSVARAAASGGGRAYRSRAPIGWYALLLVICVAGVSLTVYSRNERLHPASAAATTEGPTKNDHWHVALAIDICGKIQPNLPASSNIGTTGLRTYGDGLIDILPSVASKPANFEGKNANLATFAKNYSGLTLTRSSIKLPGQTTTYKDGTYCIQPNTKHPTQGQQREDEGQLLIEQWPSPTGKGKLVTASDPSNVHLTNGSMVTIAFVIAGTKIPEPPSKSHLVEVLGSSTTPTTAGVSPTTTSTTSSSTATSSTTASGATSSSTTTTTSAGTATSTTVPSTSST